MAEVEKYGYVVPASDAARRDGDLLALLNQSPEAMAERRRLAKIERAEVRRVTEPVPLDAATIEERLGLPVGFLLHVSQPYCDCSIGYDGIDYCPHAHDIGLPG